MINPMDLTEEQELFFELVLEHFRSSGEWPVIRDVQRQMVKATGRSVDAIEVLEGLPRSLLSHSVHSHNEAVLNARALRVLKAQAELDDLLRVVKLALSKYQSDEPEPTVSAEELRRDWGMSPLRIKKVQKLLALEPYILGGGSSGEDFKLGVSDYVHIFVGVENINQYFGAAERFKNPPDDPPAIIETSSHKLEGRQLAVFTALKEQDDNLAAMYRGAVMAAAVMGNPEHLVQASHSVRELLEKIPRFLGMDVSAQRESMGQEVRRLEDAWADLHKKTGCRKDGDWAGEIDSHLGKYLKRTQDFFNWVAENFPRRKAEIADTLRRLDASGKALPSQIEELKVTAWIKVHGFFQGVSHHTKVTSAEEFDQWLVFLDNFLLDHLKPRTFEDFEKIDALIAEGEERA